MGNEFLRAEMMFGPEAMTRLAASHVAVFGLGGVGSYVVEGLARCGVGELTLVDHDTVSETNINRQLGALHSTINREKAQVLAERVQDINPSCKVHAIVGKYSAENREAFFSSHYDYLVDAIDLVSCKLDLIEQCQQRSIPCLSALGTGNKLDATQFRITDISKTSGCPLARVVRKELRARGITHHKVLFSPEAAHETAQIEAPPPGRRSVPASVAWVPGVAGLLMAGEVVLDLSGQR